MSDEPGGEAPQPRPEPSEPAQDAPRREARVPGDAYTGMPAFSRPASGRWRLLAAAAAVALASIVAVTSDLGRAPQPQGLGRPAAVGAAQDPLRAPARPAPEPILPAPSPARSRVEPAAPELIPPPSYGETDRAAPAAAADTAVSAAPTLIPMLFYGDTGRATAAERVAASPVPCPSCVGAIAPQARDTAGLGRDQTAHELKVTFIETCEDQHVFEVRNISSRPVHRRVRDSASGYVWEIDLSPGGVKRLTLPVSARP